MTHYIQSRFCACDERIEKLLAGPWEFPDPTMNVKVYQSRQPQSKRLVGRRLIATNKR